MSQLPGPIHVVQILRRPSFGLKDVVIHDQSQFGSDLPALVCFEQVDAVPKRIYRKISCHFLRELLHLGIQGILINHRHEAVRFVIIHEHEVPGDDPHLFIGGQSHAAEEGQEIAFGCETMFLC